MTPEQRKACDELLSLLVDPAFDYEKLLHGDPNAPMPQGVLDCSKLEHTRTNVLDGPSLLTNCTWTKA